MKDTEFIERVREIIKTPRVLKDEEFALNFKSDNLKYIGQIVDHRHRVTELLQKYDNEKLVENLVKTA